MNYYQGLQKRDQASSDLHNRKKGNTGRTGDINFDSISEMEIREFRRFTNRLHILGQILASKANQQAISSPNA